MSDENKKNNNYKIIKLMIPIILIYFSTYCTVYSVQDFIFSDIKKYSTSDNITLFLYTIYCIKFFNAILVSSYADNKQNHNKLLIFGLLLYGISLFSFFIFSFYLKNVNKIISLIYLICSLIFYFSGLGIIFPMLETLGINYLKNNKLLDYFYLVKIFCSLGHMIAYIPGILIGKGGYFNLFKKLELDTLRTILGFIYSIITIFIIYFSKINYIIYNSFNKEKEIKKEIKQSFFKKLINLLSYKYFIFLITIISQGINRASTQALCRVYHKNIGISIKQGSLITCMRLIIEILIFLTLGRFKKKNLIYYFFIFCSFISILKPLLLFLMNKNDSELKKTIKLIIAEISKGIFSSFFNYSSVRIAEDLSKIENKTLSQGICAGVYSGFSSLPFILISFIVYNISWKISELETLENLLKDILERKKIKIIFFITIILGILGLIASIFLLLLKKKFNKIN